MGFVIMQSLCWSRHIAGTISFLQKTCDYLHIVTNFCNCSGFESLTTTDEKFKWLSGSIFLQLSAMIDFRIHTKLNWREIQNSISIVKNRLMMWFKRWCLKLLCCERPIDRCVEMRGRQLMAIHGAIHQGLNWTSSWFWTVLARLALLLKTIFYYYCVILGLSSSSMF